MINKEAKITREAAIARLKMLFAETTEDILTQEDAFRAGGRESNTEEQNKAWLSNKLIDLKKYGFVKSTLIKRPDGIQVRDKIILTEKGKIALERIQGELNLETEDNKQVQQMQQKGTNGVRNHTKGTTNIIPWEMLNTISKLSKENRGVKYEVQLPSGMIVSISMP